MYSTSEEQRWERMKQVLLAESRGDAPVVVSSGRTLFGIKSHAEEVIERTVEQMEADFAAKNRQQSGGEERPVQNE